ncbi:MAG: iron-sulfur protein [Oscillospiraceae bacterium]|nr:iron-sulfur protein [Oscillospiraceae bacterium]
MNILILNCSPKGQYSITLQTCLYLEIMYPEHSFDIVHAGARIKALETDLSPVAQAVNRADLIIFSYPVYTFIAPYQLHRLIELLKEQGVDLRGKFAAQISTSKHFYDVTAHRYVKDNCHDLGMKYIGGLSADMEDLTKAQGQKDARSFFEYICWCVERNIFEPAVKTAPASPSVPASAAAQVEKKSGDVVIVADLKENDAQLAGMIERFRAVCDRETRLVNIHEYPFRGGCLGCFNCAPDGKCIYTDGFDDFLRKNIQTADAIVCAFSIKDHSMGARFKLYDDRQFCNGHRTVTVGTPFGYIVSGNLSAEENLRTIMEARAQVGGNFLAGVACDESDTDASVDAMAAKLSYALDKKLTQPQNFWGVGGMKIFRDLIFVMRGMMKADHKFYKAHGQYDFPQKQKGTIMKMYLVGMLMSSSALKGKMGNKMNEGMIAPYKKALDAAKKDR